MVQMLNIGGETHVNLLSSLELLIPERQSKTKKLNSTFPTVCSTLAPGALASLVYSDYDVELIKNCLFWRRGLSDVYLVETLSKPYILRVSHHHWRSKNEIDFELELLEFLRDRQIPVASPLRTKEGNLSVEIDAPEGKRYAALFHYAPGEIALGDFNHTQSFLLGETVAKLHQATKGFRTVAYRQPLDLKHLLDDSLQIIAPFLHHRQQDLKYLLEAIALIKNQLSSLPAKSPYWVVCWGDPHSGNVHITRNNQMTLFDFDQCGYGWRVFDIAKFWQVGLQTGLSRTIRQAFLDGYRSYEKITDIELECLQALTQAAYIWAWAIALDHAKFYDYSRLDKSYFSQRLERFKQLNCKDWQLF
ncbi:phosphotransferase [Hydrococcus rivularis]|uniref:phosphotransferase n=1 Tax=Hydrococcus rivularis TaxID=1616834 RepID=UPI000A804427